TLRYHARHELGRRAETLGAHVQARLSEMAERHPLIAEVRGLGLMIGVELREPTGEPAAARLDDLLEDLKDAGFLAGKTGPSRNVLAIMPPLVVELEALDRFVDCLDGLLARIG